MAEASAGGNQNWQAAKTFYEFTANDIDGNHVSMEKYRGQVVLVVNVACK